MSYVYLFIAIFAEVAATTFLKASDGFRVPAATTLSILGYLVAFYCLSMTLRHLPTGVAYAIWSGVGTVLIAVIARIIHGQRLDAAAIIGIALITGGVITMNLFSRTSA